MKKRKNKRQTFQVLAPVCLLIALSAGGCAPASIERPYNFAERSFDMAEDTEETGRASAFAEELCVVTDDTGGGDSSITAEAAGVFGIQNPRTIYSKNVLERLYPASTTRL